MSKRITIVLTDEEYAALESRAQADRRSVRDMAARLVTQPSLILTTPQPLPIGQPWNPIWPPNVWCGSTTDAGNLPVTTWNSQNVM